MDFRFALFILSITHLYLWCHTQTHLACDAFRMGVRVNVDSKDNDVNLNFGNG